MRRGGPVITGVEIRPLWPPKAEACAGLGLIMTACTSSTGRNRGAVSAFDRDRRSRRCWCGSSYRPPSRVLPSGGGQRTTAPFSWTFLATDYAAQEEAQKAEDAALERERRSRRRLAIKKKYGKNAILKGNEFAGGRNGHDRNAQIGVGIRVENGINWKL